MDIRHELEKTVVALQGAVERAQTRLQWYDEDMDPHTVRDKNGRFILLDALVGLAQAQAALAVLPPSVGSKERLAALGVEPPEKKECEAELSSWDHFSPNAVDFYWIQCDEVGAHVRHKNYETGATWKDK